DWVPAGEAVAQRQVERHGDGAAIAEIRDEGVRQIRPIDRTRAVGKGRGVAHADGRAELTSGRGDDVGREPPERADRLRRIDEARARPDQRTVVLREALAEPE